MHDVCPRWAFLLLALAACGDDDGGGMSVDAGSGDDAGTDGSPASGLTVHTGYFPVSDGKVHVFLGDGSEHLELVDNQEGVARFADVELPQTVTVVVSSPTEGGGGLARVDVLSIIDVDVHEIWIWRNWCCSLVANRGPEEYDSDAYPGGTVALDALASADVVPIVDPLVWHVVPASTGADGVFNLTMRGKFPSTVDLVASGVDTDGDLFFGARRGIEIQPDTSAVGTVTLDAPADRELAIDTANDAAIDGTYKAQLLFHTLGGGRAPADTARVLHWLEIERETGPEIPFTATFASPALDGALGEVLGRTVWAVAGEFFHPSDYEQMDPDIQYASVTERIAGDATRHTVRYLDPVALDAPALGRYDSPASVTGPLVLTWSGDHQASAIQLSIARFTESDGDLPVSWQVFAGPGAGSFTLPALPAAVLDPALPPAGLYQLHVSKLGASGFDSPMHYWIPNPAEPYDQVGGYLTDERGTVRSAELWGFFRLE